MDKNSVDIMQIIAHNVYSKRIEQGLTQEKLAEKSNMSDSFISKLERGKIDNISIINLQGIADSLDTTISNLLSENPVNKALDKSTIKLVHELSERNDDELNHYLLAMLERMK